MRARIEFKRSNRKDIWFDDCRRIAVRRTFTIIYVEDEEFEFRADDIDNVVVLEE